MKLKYYLIAVMIALLPAGINGQQKYISYTYDANGNRTSRMILDETYLKSAVINFPVKDPEELEEADPDIEENVLVYPNPTMGLLKIELTSSSNEEMNEVRFLDLNGRTLINKKYPGSTIELDVSEFKDGTYILWIKSGKLTYNYKIVKGSGR